MLILRIGDNLNRRNEAGEFLPKFYTSLGLDNLTEIMDSVYTDFFGENKSVKILNINEELMRDFFYKNIDKLVDSKSIFFIDEISLNKQTEDKLIREINKSGGKVFDVRNSKEEDKQIKDESDNPFFLIDFYFKKDKEKAWKELMRIKDKKFVIHEVMGAFLWKANFVKNKTLYEKLLLILGKSREENSDIDLYNELEKMILVL